MTALRAIFRINPAIKTPILVDKKEQRKREETRNHMKKRYRGGYPKEIMMGEALMPPYFWHNREENCTLDPHRSGLVEKNKNTKNN